MNSLRLALIAIAPVAAAAIVGNLATMPKIATWYAGLMKPSFNPPNWVFGPVWGILYATMAYAFFRVLAGQPSPWTGAAVLLFLVQITLNASWSLAFFAAESPRAGLLVIFMLWIGILLTTWTFWQIDRWASILLWPYLAWVSFAALLNLEIARLNPR